jgi:hypothetical protein
VKHLVEANCGIPDHYVANGELIAAALMAGYPMRRDEDPNPLLGMSQRDLDRLHEMRARRGLILG